MYQSLHSCQIQLSFIHWYHNLLVAASQTIPGMKTLSLIVLSKKKISVVSMACVQSANAFTTTTWTFYGEKSTVRTCTNPISCCPTRAIACVSAFQWIDCKWKWLFYCAQHVHAYLQSDFDLIRFERKIGSWHSVMDDTTNVSIDTQQTNVNISFYFAIWYGLLVSVLNGAVNISVLFVSLTSIDHQRSSQHTESIK